MRFLVQCSIASALALCGCAGTHSATAPELGEKAPPTDSYVPVTGAWLRVRDMGVATGNHPVLLVHGYGSRLETWTLIQPHLARDRRVVSFDQRGFGKSERPESAYGPALHAKDVVELADKLGLEKPVLVGHSYGGGVALRAALDNPGRFSGLVLVDAFALDEQIPASFRWAKVPGLGEFIFATQFKEVVGEKYILAFKDRGRFATPESIGEFRNNMVQPGAFFAALHTVRGMDYEGVQERYRTIGLPTLIVWGEDDRVTPLSQGKMLAGSVDNAKLEVLSHCGHVPPWERPQALVMNIQELLARVDGHALTVTQLPVSGAVQESATP